VLAVTVWSGLAKLHCVWVSIALSRHRSWNHRITQQTVRFANNNEGADRSWLAANPDAYVVNERSHGKYLILHLANSTACIDQPGKSHTSSRALSAKICAPDRAAFAVGIVDAHHEAYSSAS
jgi:hypothetical protein